MSDWKDEIVGYTNELGDARELQEKFMTTGNELVDDMLGLGFTLPQIKDALEDGEWLGKANVSQEEAEVAHAVVSDRIAKEGREPKKITMQMLRDLNAKMGNYDNEEPSNGDV